MKKKDKGPRYTAWVDFTTRKFRTKREQETPRGRANVTLNPQPSNCSVCDYRVSSTWAEYILVPIFLTRLLGGLFPHYELSVAS